jgi:hypothetical protein
MYLVPTNFALTTCMQTGATLSWLKLSVGMTSNNCLGGTLVGVWVWPITTRARLVSNLP